MNIQASLTKLYKSVTGGPERPKKLNSRCMLQLEQLSRKHLTEKGKDHLWHQVFALGLDPIEVYNDICLSNNPEFLRCGSV